MENIYFILLAPIIILLMFIASNLITLLSVLKNRRRLDFTLQDTIAKENKYYYTLYIVNLFLTGSIIPYTIILYNLLIDNGIILSEGELALYILTTFIGSFTIYLSFRKLIIGKINSNINKNREIVKFIQFAFIGDIINLLPIIYVVYKI